MAAGIVGGRRIKGYVCVYVHVCMDVLGDVPRCVCVCVLRGVLIVKGSCMVSLFFALMKAKLSSSPFSSEHPLQSAIKRAAAPNEASLFMFSHAFSSLSHVWAATSGSQISKSLSLGYHVSQL